MILAVISSPRPGGVDYASATLDWLELQSADLDLRRFIICDSTPVIRDGWTTLEARRPWTHGGLPANKFAGWRALELSVEHDADLLFFEDDILPARPDALAIMAHWPVAAGAAWASFFDPAGRPPGMYDRRVFTHCQALKVPAGIARWLVSVRAIIPGDWELARGFDEALAALDCSVARQYEVADALVSHVGLVSIANPR